MKLILNCIEQWMKGVTGSNFIKYNLNNWIAELTPQQFIWFKLIWFMERSECIWWKRMQFANAITGVHSINFITLRCFHSLPSAPRATPLISHQFIAFPISQRNGWWNEFRSSFNLLVQRNAFLSNHFSFSISLRFIPEMIGEIACLFKIK